MQVSVEASVGLERRLHIQVPAEKIEKEIAARLASVGRKAKIQGFRPGKVPAKVLRQRYGAQVRQEVLQDVLQSSYSEAVTQENLQPAGSPTIEAGNVGEGEDFSYTAIIEIYPEVELKGLKNIKIDSPEVEVSQPDIDTMIENLRKQRADWSAVDRKAAEGDQVTLDFVGTLKGEPFEGGTAEGFKVVLGEGSMLPDFEKNLAGVSAGTQKSFKLKFPKDYHAQNLAGQKAEFEITVSEVAEQVLPEIDAEFVKAFGVETGEIEGLRADIRANMEREVAGKVRAELRRQLLDGLLSANEFEVPGVLVEQESRSMQADAMQRMGIQDPEQAPGLDTFKIAAEKRVRIGLLMSTAIKDNGISLDQGLVTRKLDELCAPYENPDQIKSIYLQNQQLMSQIQNAVLEDQVIDWLLSQVQVKPKKMAFQELMELPA